MAKSDPQSQRKRTWGEFLFGGEDAAVKRADYKRQMGIDPKNKRLQNVEVSASAKSMDNPTSGPSRTAPSSGKAPLRRQPKNPNADIGVIKRSTTPVAEPKAPAVKSFKDKQQGRKVPGSPTSPEALRKTPKTEAPRASKAPSKAPAQKKALSPFERQKQMRYEEEGYGGRSMTRESAKRQVERERAYKTPKISKGKLVDKFKDIFK